MQYTYLLDFSIKNIIKKLKIAMQKEGLIGLFFSSCKKLTPNFVTIMWALS